MKNENPLVEYGSNVIDKIKTKVKKKEKNQLYGSSSTQPGNISVQLLGMNDGINICSEACPNF